LKSKNSISHQIRPSCRSTHPLLDWTSRTCLKWEA
jgi:hypothetical protein